MMIVYLGSSINTPDIWGWAERGYACDLRRAVTEGLNVNTTNIGRSSGFVVPLPSLIQAGWVLAHEIGHLLDSHHIKQDPVMDPYFHYLPALRDYKASCAAKMRMYETCVYDAKNWKFTDYYGCD